MRLCVPMRSLPESPVRRDANHKVLRGSLIQDAFVPIMQGFAFYDDLRIGDEVLD